MDWRFRKHATAGATQAAAAATTCMLCHANFFSTMMSHFIPLTECYQTWSSSDHEPSRESSREQLCVFTVCCMLCCSCISVCNTSHQAVHLRCSTWIQIHPVCTARLHTHVPTWPAMHAPPLTLCEGLLHAWPHLCKSHKVQHRPQMPTCLQECASVQL